MSCGVYDRSKAIKDRIRTKLKILWSDPFYREKMSKKLRGIIRRPRKPLTMEQRLNLSQSHIGHIPSEETKRKMSSAHKGIIFSKSHKENISKNRRGKNVGENHPGWNGGYSIKNYPSVFNRQIKERIRVRDNFKCQICGIPELETLTRLDVHHINYNKKDCAESNLISLCKVCHTKTNYDRLYWKSFLIVRVSEVQKCQ
jgi:5-methylcytosine-specific restriction endonuclease McrA